VADDKKTVVKMAYIYSQEGRWDKAAIEYKKLIVLDPEDFNAQNMLGDVFVKKGEHQPAYDYYMVAADAYNRLGQMEKSSVVYRKIAKLDPSQLSGEAKRMQAVLQKQVEGEAAVEAGDLDKAAEAFKMVLQLDTERFDIYQKLGDIYLQQDKPELAVKQYSEIADIYFKNKLHKKAAPLYKKITELDPGHVEAHAGLGEIHARSGNESEAKKEYLLIAETLLAKGDLETSMGYAKKALQLKSIEAYYFMGRIFFMQKKFDEAKEEFEKLLKFKLNHVGALVSMGDIFEAKGQLAEAQQHYERALKAEKNNVDALGALGRLHAKKGEIAKAVALYEEAAQACAILNHQEKVDEYRALAAQLSQDHQDVPGPVAAEAPQPPSALPSLPRPLTAIQQAVQEAPAPALPPLPARLPEPVQPEIDPAEERAIIMSMADNYVAEKSFDEAIELYQRILSANPMDKEAKDAMAGVYSMVAKGATDHMEAAKRAADAAAQAEQLKADQNAAEHAAKQTMEESRKLAEAEMRKNLEIEIRKQIEEEMRKKMTASPPPAVAPPPAQWAPAPPVPVPPAPPVPAPTPPVPVDGDILKKKSKVSYL
jgi:tetratricopeptide (TPR) repeat protein